MNLKEEELKIFPKLLIAIVCCGGLKREREEERGEGLWGKIVGGVEGGGGKVVGEGRKYVCKPEEWHGTGKEGVRDFEGDSC